MSFNCDGNVSEQKKKCNNINMLNENTERWKSDLLAAQKGDKVSYERFLSEINTFLLGYLSPKIFQKDMLEDVVQEVLIAVHHSRHTFDHDRPILPWLLSIAKYKTIDYIRKHEKKKKNEETTESLWETFEEKSSESDIDTKWEVEEYLAQLPQKQRHLIQYIKIDGHSVKSAAEKFSMSISNVKTTVHRAMKRLKREPRK